MKRKMKIASSKHARNLSGSHYTTLGFGDLTPAYFNECVIGDEVTIKPNLFARSAPLNLPNLGNLSVSNRCFYVTFSSVWRYYEQFLQGNPVSYFGDEDYSVIETVPTFCRYDFLKILTDNFDSLPDYFSENTDSTASNTISQLPFDFYIFNPSSADDAKPIKYYTLTKAGKQVLKVLQALDYNFNFQMPTNSTSYPLTILYNVERVSALPLLCFFKVIYDYYIPSNLRPSSYMDQLFTYINNQLPLSGNISWDALYFAFQNVHLYHDSNYFTSQWLSPNEPTPYLSNFGNLLSNSFDIATSESSSGYDYEASSDSPSSYSDSNNVAGATQDTQYMSNNISFTQMKIVNQLRTFIMRNNLVGSRPIQRLFARFGVNVPELQLEMSQYYGNYDIPIQTSDVVTTGSVNELGELGGKSVINQDREHTFKINCTQNGVCFVIASIDVPSSYTSGMGRHLYHTRPFSFYTPEFDDSVMQATRGNELVGRIVGGTFNGINNVLSQHNLTDQNTFGFIERYAEYKYGKNRISGDFNVRTLMNPIYQYILPRQAYDFEQYNDDLASTDVASASGKFSDALYYTQYNPVTTLSQSDAYQFNRIYKDISGIADPFNCEFLFDVHVFGPVKSNELDDYINGDGKEIKYDVNGPHLN